MEKKYAIVGIAGIVFLLSTIGVFAHMNNGLGMVNYRNNMMGPLYQSQNMMQGYSYESMKNMHNSIVASIQDPELRNSMNKMYSSCMGKFN